MKNTKNIFASELGKRSAEIRKKRVGKKEFRNQMIELSKKRWLNKAV